MCAMSTQNELDAASARDVTLRVLAQRVSRYSDSGPDLAPIGSARYRHDGRRLLVGYATTHPGMARTVVQRVSAYARGLDLTVHWLVTPETPGEEELPAALRAAGFQLDERLILMARRGAIATRTNSAARIEPIASYEAMCAYEHGSRRSFYDEDQPNERMVASRAADRWRQQTQGWYRYYLTLLDGQVVGGCYVTQWEQIPTLMGVYTIAEARGRGAATTLLHHVTSELARTGRDPYCLYVKDDNPAQALYAQLGFKRLTTDETYLSPVGKFR